MRVALLHPDRDLDLASLPEPDADLVADLELERLFRAMAGGDTRIFEVVRRLLASAAVRANDAVGPGGDPQEAVLHRQAAIADAISAPETVRALYRLASDAVEAERRVWGGALRNAELVLRRSVEVLEALLAAVAEMRDVLARDRAALRSPAMHGLADRLAAEADDAFVARATAVLEQLRRPTLAVTGGLGPGNRPAAFVLRRPGDARRRLRDRIGLAGLRGYAIDVTLHDQNAMNALGELRARAVADAAGAVAEASAHLLAFCTRLRDETAFLVGCANLDAALAERGVARSRPSTLAAVDGEPRLDAAEIVDPCLALAADGPVVGNDVHTGVGLTVVTGANGGGKSTLLRAVGVARLMHAAGLPVAAGGFTARIPAGILVHFPRPEEAGEGSGRLDAELGRLDALVRRARPNTLVLLNEPLSTVNERDGSAITGDLVRGLVAGGAEVWLVTHHHELAAGLHASPPAGTRFLRAERGEGSARPFRVIEAPPLHTSFGVDLWAAEVDAVVAPPGAAASREGPASAPDDAAR